MAYRNKFNHIQNINPDIVVVPECEKPESNTSKRLWFGDNKNKGIGIFSYSDFELELNRDYNPLFRYVIPLKIKGSTDFNLLAVWAMNEPKEVQKRYIAQVWLAINYYKTLLDEPLIIIGDFNWNTIWDAKPNYPLYGNLTNIIKILKNKKIESSYHTFFGEDFGKETKPTLFMYHKKSNPYHVDYCFASENFKLEYVEIGDYSDWSNKSDHMPLIVNFHS